MTENEKEKALWILRNTPISRLSVDEYAFLLVDESKYLERKGVN